MRDRPRIGLIGNLEHRRTWRLDIPLRYAESVRRAGGLPLGIHPSTDERELEALIAHLDGIVLIGGDDFGTGWAAGWVGPSPSRAVSKSSPPIRTRTWPWCASRSRPTCRSSASATECS